MRRTDTIDGLTRRMNSLLRSGKLTDAAQEFADVTCEVFINGKDAGSGKSAVKKLAEKMNANDPASKFELLNHTVSDDDHSYSEWRIISETGTMNGVLLCQWENNSVISAKIYGAQFPA